MFGYVALICDAASITCCVDECFSMTHHVECVAILEPIAKGA